REAGFSGVENARRLRRAARDTEHGTEEIVQVAEPLAFRRLFRLGTDGRLGGVPVLVRERGLLGEQHRDDEQETAQAAEHGRGFSASTISPGTLPTLRSRDPSAAS